MPPWIKDFSSLSAVTYCMTVSADSLHKFKFVAGVEPLGYKPSAHAFKSTDGWRKLQRLRAHLFGRLSELFPSRLGGIPDLPPVGQYRMN
jgi:hypothetical protein